MVQRVQNFWNRYNPSHFKVQWGLGLLLVLLSLIAFRPDRPILAALDLALHGGVNHRLPDVQAPKPGLHFTDSPSDAEFLTASIFPQPLTPVGRTSAQENRDLARAIIDYSLNIQLSDEPDRVEPLLAFLSANPQSAWRPALLVNVGMIYRHTGHFSKAMATLQDAWSASKDLTDPNGRVIGDTAVAELSQFEAYLGRKETLAPLLAGVKGRSLHGTAAELMSSSSRGLAHMQQWPQDSFRCGPLALIRILMQQSSAPSQKTLKVLYQSKSTPNGLSLTMVQRMSAQAGMNYQMAFRTPGAPMVTPAVANWKMGHYAAIVGSQNGRYLVQDATFNEDIRINEKTLDEESSGYFLIPAGALPHGWRAVSASEGNKVWGRGDTGSSRDNDGTDPEDDTPAFDDDSNCAGGCTTWNVEPMTVSLTLHDMPVGYTPSVGPAIDIKVDYAHRDIQQPDTFNYVNMGPKWTITWLSYVTDSISSNRQAKLYDRGGGAEIFTMPSTVSTQSNPGPYTQSVLVRTVDGTGKSTGFVRWLKDGSSETFGQAFGAKFFMTKVTDPQGNSATISYDSQMRIAGITDAIGQVTTFSYESSDPLKITKITDPFGRAAKFTYNSSGQLATITDTIGITSSFTYGSADFVNTLTTPYGVSHFDYGDSSTNPSLGDTRYINITDALGRKSRVEFNQFAYPYASDSRGVPAGMDAYNYYLNWRNSFIWNPEQYKAATATSTLDYSKAKVIHWLHLPDGSGTSRTIESIKEPNEGRVWFRYPGQGSDFYYIYAGTSNTPIYIGRVLDDGSTQLKSYQYNAYGKVTQYTDPEGRTTQFSYASNGIDLTSLKNVTAGKTLVQISYNAQHLPLSVTGANGTTMAYEYNAIGRPTKITNALGQVTTYAYDGKNELTTVQGPLPAATHGFTYDSVGRVATATDPANATVSYQYDDADRPTKVSFPDGTSSQFNYNLLDLASTTDRLGHTINLTHDAERQLLKVTDPAGNITQYSYTGSGKLASITDPNGHITGVTRDIQDRIIGKSYADGTSQSINYEASTSRIQSIKDALGQATAYSYNVDDTPSAVTYTSAPKVSFTYDAAYQRPLRMTDGVGVTTYSYYDAGGLGANLLKTVTSPVAGGGSTQDTVGYSYDALNRVTDRKINGVDQSTSYDTLGRVTGVANALDRFSYAYADATPRVTGVTSGKGPTLGLAYFDGSHDELLKTMTYSAAGKTLSQFDYEFNANDNVTEFTESYLGESSTVLASLPGFGGASKSGSGGPGGGSLLASALGNVNAHEIAASQALEYVTALVLAALAMSGLGWLAFFGNRKWRAIAMIPPLMATTLLTGCGGGKGGGLFGLFGASGGVSSQATSYSYDSADRLTSASVGMTLTPQYGYDYDAASNITGMSLNGTKKSLSYNSTNGISTGTYDANGSPTALDGAGYAWDGADRLVKFTSGTTESDFTYDGLSRLVRIIEKTAGAVTADHAYTWCGMARCLERDNLQSNSPVSKQYFAQGEIQGATALYYVIDRLGSVRQLVDNTGTVQAQYDYGPYGTRIKVSGTEDSDFGFTGLFHHAASGLDFAVHRAYDAGHARWLNRDPISEAGGLNLYRYGGSNPTNLIDPLGLCPTDSDSTDSDQSDWDKFLEAAEDNWWLVPAIVATEIAGGGPEDPAADALVAEEIAEAEALTAETATETAAGPDFVVTPDGEVIPIPEGASGPTPTNNGLGVQYNGGSGGNGLPDNVTDVRIMEPNSRNPNGYVNYGSRQGDGGWQTVDPATGNSVGKSDPAWHIPLKGGE